MGTTILIIDDEKFLCRQLEKDLSQEGYNIITAFTGKEGIELANKESPVVILLDLKLPDADGLGVLQSIAGVEPNPSVIFMTAHGNVEVAVSAIKMGAYDFIEKPFHIDKLKIMVKNAVDTTELRRSVDLAKSREQGKYGFNALIGKSE